MTNSTATVVTAWSLVGQEGQFRVWGGKQIYEAAFNAKGDQSVKLAYLRADSKGLRQVNRYVHPDTPIEVIRNFTAEQEAAREADYDEYRRQEERDRQPIDLKRTAVVRAVTVAFNPQQAVSKVQYYLPSNFKAELSETEPSLIVISGHDVLGWTLQDYVIPRLASGLIFATEVQS